LALSTDDDDDDDEDDDCQVVNLSSLTAPSLPKSRVYKSFQSSTGKLLGKKLGFLGFI